MCKLINFELANRKIIEFLDSGILNDCAAGGLYLKIKKRGDQIQKDNNVIFSCFSLFLFSSFPLLFSQAKPPLSHIPYFLFLQYQLRSQQVDRKTLLQEWTALVFLFFLFFNPSIRNKSPVNYTPITILFNRFAQ